MNKQSLSRYITITIRTLFGLALFVCFILFVSYASKHEGEGAIPENIREITNWVYKTENGDTIAARTPINANVEAGETVVYKAVLPEGIIDGDYVSTTNSKNIRFEIDGEVRYEWTRDEADVVGGPTHPSFVYVPVYAKDSGKEILVTKYGKTFNGGFEPLVLGDAHSVISYYKREYGASQFLIAIFIMALAMLIIICGLIIRIITRKDIYLISACFAVMTAAAWLIMDSMEFQLYFGIKHIDGFIAYILAMLMVFPFLAYLDAIQKYRYRNYYSLLASIEVVNLIVCTSCHLSGTANFQEMLFFMNGTIGIVIVGAFICTVYDVAVVKEHGYRVVSIGLLVFMVLGFAEIFFIQHKKPWIDGIFIELGLFVVLVTAVAQQIKDIMDIEQERKLAFKANEARNEFLTNMSHEIRTPINAILGMNEMIMQENHSSVIKGYSEHIGQAGQVLLSLVNDILDYSTIQNGNDFIETIDYRPREILNTVTAVLKENAQSKKLNVIINIAEDIPEYLHGDARHIVRILKNICSNAVKFTDKGQIEFTAQCKADEANAGYLLEFYVKDSGTGIRHKDVEKLFSAFNRIDIKKNRALDGAGLGLAISRSLAEAMNGTIEVESVFGEGSTFIIKIPQGKVDTVSNNTMPDSTKEQDSLDSSEHSSESVAAENASGGTALEAQSELEDLAQAADNVILDCLGEDDLDGYGVCYEAPRAKILAVDDNMTNLIVVREFLKDTKVDLEVVTSGLEAIERCNDKKYDIILMDHMMPEPDGVETMHVIRQSLTSINRKTVMIVLTANVIGDCKREYLQEGFDGYLSKPVKRSRLLKTVRKYLDDKIVTDLDEVVESDDGNNEPEAEVIDSSVNTFEERGIIDFDGLFMRFEGQKQVAQMILGECVKEGERKIVLLRELYELGDIERYAIEAHGVKGVMASVCANDFSAHAKEHEFAAKEGRVDYISNDIDKFLTEYREVLDYIVNYLRSEGIEVSVPVMVNYDGENSTEEEFVASIRQALDDFDVDEALKHISGLYEIVDEDKKNIVEEVRQYTDDFEYDLALESLDKL